MSANTERRWRLLGAVRLLTSDGEIDPGGGKQACVLASLLLTPGRPVPVETLIDRVWAGSPPRSATAVAPYATRLRRVLEPVGDAGVLRHTPAGYVLDCNPEKIDIHDVRREVRAAAEMETSGDTERAAGRYAAALRDWEPEALAGVPGDWAAGVREVIGRERLDVFARYGRLLLRRGRPGEVVAMFDPLVAEHPTAEPLVAVLMTALAESGRPAAALRGYARARDAIADQLGAHPSAELTGLNARILRHGREAAVDVRPGRETAADPRPSRGAALGRPAQLPAAPAGFIGRAAELGRLDAAAGLAVISGPPGVGKSALAVHWGHHARDRFPDGQLYLNLRGFDPGGPLSPDDAARDLLTALLPAGPLPAERIPAELHPAERIPAEWIPAEWIPAGLDARSALLRSVLAGRRMLLVLDNARDAGQVRPLLPGAAGCAVVVTSRDRMLGLVAALGAAPVVLAPLSPGESESLLTGRLGEARDPASVRALAAATAGLPLALVTVAARASTRASLASVVCELAQSRLDGLRGPDDTTDPRTVFSWSYRALSPPAARLFRLLGTLTGRDLAADAASSLLGEPAARAIDELTAASLLAEHRPDRYVPHDLLRDYAATLTGAAERDAARRRLLDHHLRTAVAAAMVLDPGREPIELPPSAGDVFPVPMLDERAAFAWFTGEHENLMAALLHPDTPDPYGWMLPWAMVAHLDRRGYSDDWVVAGRRAAEAARRCGLPRAEAFAHRMLARAYARQGRPRRAVQSFQRALAVQERAA